MQSFCKSKSNDIPSRARSSHVRAQKPICKLPLKRNEAALCLPFSERNELRGAATILIKIGVFSSFPIFRFVGREWGEGRSHIHPHPHRYPRMHTHTVSLPPAQRAHGSLSDALHAARANPSKFTHCSRTKPMYGPAR